MVVACFAEDPFPELRCDETVTGTVGDYSPWYRFDPSVTDVAVVSLVGPCDGSSAWLGFPLLEGAHGDYVRESTCGKESSTAFVTRPYSELILEVGLGYGTRGVAGASYNLDPSCTSKTPCGAYVAHTITPYQTVWLPFGAAQNFTILSFCTNGSSCKFTFEISDDDVNQVSDVDLPSESAAYVDFYDGTSCFTVEKPHC